jgi:hypothetical protein
MTVKDAVIILIIFVYIVICFRVILWLEKPIHHKKYKQTARLLVLQPHTISELPGGIWHVQGTEFRTTDRTLARAVAVELDRVDPLDSPKVTGH